MLTKRPSWLVNAFIEMVVVVSSILIAFTLDAWWDTRAERGEEQEMLEGLLVEFREVQDQIAEQQSFHQAMKETTLALMELSVSESWSMETDSLDAMLGDLFWWGGESNYSTGALSSAIASGKLSLIQNNRLRDLLSEWPRALGDIADNERNEIWEFREGFKPFMRENANMPQIANRITSEPGQEELYPVTRVPEGSIKTDHSLLVKSPEFHNLLLFRLWTNDDILNEIDEFIPPLEEILDLLETELQR